MRRYIRNYPHCCAEERERPLKNPFNQSVFSKTHSSNQSSQKQFKPISPLKTHSSNQSSRIVRPISRASPRRYFLWAAWGSGNLRRLGRRAPVSNIAILFSKGTRSQRTRSDETVCFVLNRIRFPERPLLFCFHNSDWLECTAVIEHFVQLPP